MTFKIRRNRKAFIATHPITGVDWVYWSYARLLIGLLAWQC